MGNLTFANNIWSDATGGMPRFSVSKPETFDPQSEQVLRSNVYFNDGEPIPTEPEDVLVPANDPQGHVGDPQLGNPNEGLVLPRWDPEKQQFLSGESTIAAEFARLVHSYAVPGDGSIALDAADPDHMPHEDILQRQRGTKPDIGCYEKEPEGGEQ